MKIYVEYNHLWTESATVLRQPMDWNKINSFWKKKSKTVGGTELKVKIRFPSRALESCMLSTCKSRTARISTELFKNLVFDCCKE